MNAVARVVVALGSPQVLPEVVHIALQEFGLFVIMVVSVLQKR